MNVVSFGQFLFLSIVMIIWFLFFGGMFWMLIGCKALDFTLSARGFFGISLNTLGLFFLGCS